MGEEVQLPRLEQSLELSGADCAASSLQPRLSPAHTLVHVHTIILVCHLFLPAHFSPDSFLPPTICSFTKDFFIRLLISPSDYEDLSVPGTELALSWL